MAIDYALQYLCEVRKAIPAQQLGSMVKHKGQVDAQRNRLLPRAQRTRANVETT